MVPVGPPGCGLHRVDAENQVVPLLGPPRVGEAMVSLERRSPPLSQWGSR